MHTRYLTIACGLALALPAAAPAQKQAPPAPGEPRSFRVPATRTFRLDNGMRVTLVPYGTIPKATVQLAVRAGNANEGPEQVWLADLTGDLMQEGTTTRSAEQVAREVSGMGGALNVSVGADQTTVGADVLSESAPAAARLIADVVRNPAFPAAELPRLRATRVRQLSIARSQPGQVAQERFRAALYPGHPYGRIFPTEAMLQGYSVEQVRAFHAAHFNAARSHLYVAGVFDAQAVERAVREAFAGWKAGSAAAVTAPRPSRQRVLHLIDRPGAVQSTIVMGLPVVDPSHPDYLAMQVTNALLGGSFASRITSNIREQKGYTYSPNSSVSIRRRDAFWAEVADVTTNVTGPSLKEIFYEVERLRSEPPSPQELRGIQNYVAGTFVLQNSSRGGIIGQLQFLELQGLGKDFLESFVQRVHAVTPADVQRVARTYLDPAQMTIVVVGDRSKIADQLAPYGKVE